MRSNAGNIGRPLMIGREIDASGVNGLPFLQHDDIVEVKKVQCAGGFQPSDISNSRLRHVSTKGYGSPAREAVRYFPARATS